MLQSLEKILMEGSIEEVVIGGQLLEMFAPNIGGYLGVVENSLLQLGNSVLDNVETGPNDVASPPITDIVLRLAENTLDLLVYLLLCTLLDSLLLLSGSWEIQQFYQFVQFLHHLLIDAPTAEPELGHSEFMAHLVHDDCLPEDYSYNAHHSADENSALLVPAAPIHEPTDRHFLVVPVLNVEALDEQEDVADLLGPVDID